MQRPIAFLLLLSFLLLPAQGFCADKTGARLLRLPKVLRGPYLQLATPTSIIVRWRTDLYCESVVVYGTNTLDLKHVAKSHGVLTEHLVQLTNLRPNTKYFYAVGSTVTNLLAGPDRAQFFYTPPLTGSPRPARVWVLGDPGTATEKQRRVRDAYYIFTTGRYTDLCLLLGDNAYPTGADYQYQDGIFDVYPWMLKQTCLWPSLGNHDILSANSNTQSGPYFDIFTLPTMGQAGGFMSGTEAYYSFDYANIHFIALDSEDSSRAPDGAMAMWLRLDLAATPQTWIVAYWHHPPFTKGGHDSDIDKSDETEMREMRENILPILEASGVDLVLCGHSHSYERSYLIDGFYGKSGAFRSEYIINARDGRRASAGLYVKPLLRTAHSGTVYVVAGSAGQTSGGPLKHPVMHTSLNELGSLILDFNGHRLDATFLNDQGEERDQFAIVKR
jgi:acid phosphatase type 7